MTNATYVYALPNATDTEGLFEIFRYVNYVSDGIFIPVIMLVIWVVAFVSMLAITSPSRAFTYSCFLAAILSIMPAILGLLAVKYMYMLILGFACGILWIKLENGS